MGDPDFIVPPPGLVPQAPESTAPDRTVRAVPPRGLPSFAPGRGLPAAPPGAPLPMPPIARPVPQQPIVEPAPEQQVPEPEAIAPPQAGTAEVRLVAASGLEIIADGALVLGRDPVAAAAPGARAVAVDDPARTVSKTHAIVEPVDGGLRVTDLGSTNGVRIESPGGALQELAPREPVLAPLGAALYLGELGFRVDRVVARG